MMSWETLKKDLLENAESEERRYEMARAFQLLEGAKLATIMAIYEEHREQIGKLQDQLAWIELFLRGVQADGMIDQCDA